MSSSYDPSPRMELAQMMIQANIVIGKATFVARHMSMVHERQVVFLM